MEISPKVEATLGAGLFTAPAWVQLLNEASTVLSFIAALCGAIVGIHSLYRIWKRRRDSKRADPTDKAGA